MSTTRPAGAARPHGGRAVGTLRIRGGWGTAVLAAALLTGCASGTSAGASSGEPSSSGAAVSSTATAGVTASASTTASAPTAASGSTAASAPAGAAASSPGMLMPPQRLRPADHPSLLRSVTDAGTTRTLTVQPAKVVITPGDQNMDANWVMDETSDPRRTYAVAPDARFFLSARLAGLAIPADGGDSVRVTWQQFVSYARKADPALQLFLVLDAQNRAVLVYQLYHP